MQPIYNPFCLSSYLSFRYVVSPDESWIKTIKPAYPSTTLEHQTIVNSATEIEDQLDRIVKSYTSDRCGILLSGGIDSSIVASFLPAGTKAYTIRFEAANAIDESPRAAEIAKQLHLDHQIITVTLRDYQQLHDHVSWYKKAPLHQAEIGIYLASQTAAQDGVTKLFVGNGADSTFGGMDKLLSQDWTVTDFIRRYTFQDPSLVLRQPVDLNHVFHRYQKDGLMDVSLFLKVIHGLGIIQAFDNAITCARNESVAPFEQLKLGVPLDIARIRHGEPKYLLTEVFNKRFPDLQPVAKIPFARPMDIWMRDYQAPTRPEFKPGINVDSLSGEQKWQLYSLERFLNLLDRHQNEN